MMRILILNWRDVKNPNSGGSEIYFHELAKRWVMKGHEVFWLSGGWDNYKKREIIDGIKIMRIGQEFSVYAFLPLAYFKSKINPEVIIDVENGIPFFSPLFTSQRIKKILHIHHVHEEIWDRESKFPVSKIGRWLESEIMPRVYKKWGVVTISQSSAEEISRRGYSKKILGIVNPGVKSYDYKKMKKTHKPMILFLNRIKRYKGIITLLKATKILNEKGGEFSVIVAGEGNFLGEAKKFSENNNLNNVTFVGRVSENQKKELMQKAWVFVNPSFKEGWGIVNIEANYFGTLVIGSNVGGIKDSILEGKTGQLFKYGDEVELANKIEEILKNPKRRKKMENRAKQWSKKFSWDKKANQYLKIIECLK